MLRIPLSAMVLVGLASVGASAQTDVEREGIAMRQRCHRAATVVEAGVPHEEIWPSLDDLAEPPEGHGVSTRGDARSHPGPRRLPADIRAQGVEVFRVLAHDPSPRIARAASYLLNVF